MIIGIITFLGYCRSTTHQSSELALPDLQAWQPLSGTEHNRQVDFREQPLPVLSNDGIALAARQRRMLYILRCCHRIHKH